jgi:voltage-gated potassium channel
MSVIRGYLKLAAHWRWRLLLGLILTMLLIDPFLGDGQWVDLLLSILFAAIVLGTIVASDIGDGFAGAGYAAAGVWTGLKLLDYFGLEVSVAMALASLVLLVGVILATFTFLVTHRQSSGDALVGAVFGYFLLILAWAVVFVQIESYGPGAFDIDTEMPIRQQFSYFSMVTITTLGYGDITPKTPQARALAGLAAASGVLYIAVLVGSIIGGFQYRGNTDR